MTTPTLRSLATQLRKEYERHGRGLGKPELWVMATYRFGHWANEVGGVRGKLYSRAYGPLYLGMLLATGCTINREAQLGEDFHLIHAGNVKIHPAVKIGKRVGVMHDVTIGTNMTSGVPEIGDDVFIGAGAKILGEVKIGDGAWIAANSLVINDVPPGATAIGVPARNVRYTKRNQGATDTPASPRSAA